MGRIQMFWPGVALLFFCLLTQTASSIVVEIDQAHAVDPTIPVIAAPVDFEAYLVDESTVVLSWNPILLDGSDVDYFNIWDNHSVIASTTDNQWRFEGIDRNDHYDFAISAVTTLGEETRRSSRIYYDLPQLDADVPDGYNQYLPPLTNLNAKVVSADSVELSWDAAPAHWSWADPSEYSYAIIVDSTYVDVVTEPRYTYTGLANQGQVRIGVSAIVDNELRSRQPQRVLVDTSMPIGTLSSGVTGFNSHAGLRTEVYSSTAAELFWEKGAASQVYVNGRLVARMLEGRSLFIENLPPGERLLVSVGDGWPYDVAPEFNWFLHYDYPLMHAWIDMPDGAVPDTDTPTAPVTGLRAEAYSSSAAEVFWDRSDTVLTRYRVYLNDVFVVETYATSWFFDGLTADTPYTVGVVATEPADAEGNRSGTLVEISFKTLSEYSTSAMNCDVDGLVATVYGSRAAEVFWHRDPAGPRYDLFLNGEFLTNTDATSWFFGALEPASKQELTIMVVDDNCDDNKSSVQFTLNTSGSIDSDTDSSDDNSIINRDNHVELVREVFRIFVGDYYTTALEQASEFSIVGRNPDSSFIDVFNCESGSMAQTLNPTSTNAGVFFSFTFDQCQLEDEIRNGKVSGQDSARGLHFNTEQYSVWQYNENRFLYNGFAQKWVSQTAFFDSIHSFDTTGFSVEASFDAEDLTLHQMNTSFAYGSQSSGLDSAWLRGGFNAQLESTRGSNLMVNIPVEFQYLLNIRTDGVSVGGVTPQPTAVSSEQRNNWTFTSGQLDLAAEDGSSLHLDAGNGDPATVTITIVSAKGVEVFDQAWSLWSDDLRFEDYPNLAR